LEAGSFYDQERYEEAAKAYQIAFTDNNIREIANHPLYKDLDYCLIHKTDQRFVNTDKSNMEQFQKDKSKRAALMKQNFKDLISYAELHEFPYVEPNTSVLDSCKYWAVTMTMIHAAQVELESLFSKKNLTKNAQ